MALVNDIIAALATYTSVVGEDWLRANKEWVERFLADRMPWYAQVEEDLGILRQHVDLDRLVTCYRSVLREQRSQQEAFYEIHGAGFLAKLARTVDLHVPRDQSSGRNFDVRAHIGEHVVNAEAKTRRDEFPFNMPVREVVDGIPIAGGKRATLDPHDAVELGIRDSRPREPNEIATPESTVIRQRFLGALGQLPPEGLNIVLFGHLMGDRRDLEEALGGTEIVEVRKHPATRRPEMEWVRLPTGAFGDPAFRALSGVLWYRLSRIGDVLGRAYSLCLNGDAQVMFPDGLAALFTEAMNREERIIEVDGEDPVQPYD